MFRGIDSWCELCGEWRWHCLAGGLEFGCVCGRGGGRGHWLCAFFVRGDLC